MASQNIAILGATGSVGRNALAVIAQHPEQFRVFALTANVSIETLLAQCISYQPAVVAVRQRSAAAKLRSWLSAAQLNIEVLEGEAGLLQVATLAECQIVIAAIIGSAGLLPTLAAAKQGKRLLLANKEALVMAGPLFMQTINQANTQLLPLDSEHNAIFQCLPTTYQCGTPPEQVAKISLTVSGGPFWDWPATELCRITPAQAVKHPNWQMGQKISIDSATFMNKGLEVIEASYLFQLAPSQIEVLLHPQSIIHSLVHFVDQSWLAQLGAPDMCIPIAYGLSWPQRLPIQAKPLDLLAVAKLEFFQPDRNKFPCLKLAEQALVEGKSLPTILNASNEIAVQAFLQQQITFVQIPVLIEKVMQQLAGLAANTLEEILALDQRARQLALTLL
jgi:1-deoxy-D-xylulose-5-phosphate reductoisomerase